MRTKSQIPSSFFIKVFRTSTKDSEHKYSSILLAYPNYISTYACTHTKIKLIIYDNVNNGCF